jgi:hypothetical protein
VITAGSANDGCGETPDSSPGGTPLAPYRPPRGTRRAGNGSSQGS